MRSGKCVALLRRASLWHECVVDLPSIRRARPEDAAGIYHAHKRSICELCARDYTAQQIDAWGRRPYDEAYMVRTIREHGVWVVEHNGEIGGFGQVRIELRSDAVSGFVEGLYLVPEMTGRGYGRRLLEVMERHAARSGAHEMQLNSTLTARHFYLAMGYEEQGDLFSFNIRGVGVPSIPMGKRLVAADDAD